MLDLDIISSELRAGRPILVFDQKDREGETDIFFSAKYSSNSSIRFLRENGGGMIFLAADNFLEEHTLIKYSARFRTI